MMRRLVRLDTQQSIARHGQSASGTVDASGMNVKGPLIKRRVATIRRAQKKSCLVISLPPVLD